MNKLFQNMKRIVESTNRMSNADYMDHKLYQVIF